MASSRNSASRTVSHGQSLPIPASPQRGRRRSPVAARAVLKAALELLDDHAVGYQGLTMKAVAERAGVSKATLYRWWPDKRHLVLDAYRSRSARDIPVRLTGDLRADLAAHLGRLAFILNNAATARTLTDIIVGAAHDPSFGRLFAETLLHERRAAILAIFRTWDDLNGSLFRFELRRPGVTSARKRAVK